MSYPYVKGGMFAWASWLTNTQAGRLVDSERQKLKRARIVFGTEAFLHLAPQHAFP